jgi:putative ABC transport system ATP-binding protein
VLRGDNSTKTTIDALFTARLLIWRKDIAMQVTNTSGTSPQIATQTTPRGSAAGTPMIKLANVSKVYRFGEIDVPALADVVLEVIAGEFVVVLGPSGSGKTTLLNLIGALDTATSGAIHIDNRQVTGASRSERSRFRRRTVSFIFQTFNLFPGLTALENVQFGVEVVGRKEQVTSAADVLQQVGLGARLHNFPSQLSGGEQQRVAIARALATDNPVLLADEPTGQLDFETGVQILELLQAQAAAGKTVLVVTHNREISRIADRVIELSSGRIENDGPPRGGKADVSDLHW